MKTRFLSCTRDENSRERGFRLFWLFISLLILTACQTRISPVVPEPIWLEATAPKELPSAPAKWQYKAKVGLRINGKSEQATLVWHRFVSELGSPSNVVRLFGPLGTGAVRLEFGGSSAHLIDEQGREYSGVDPEKLLAEVVGWHLPVNALPYWLLAQPKPGHVYQYQSNQLGEMTAINQFGWAIEFLDWRSYQGRKLPRKLSAKKTFEEQPGVDVSVKFITKSWDW